MRPSRSENEERQGELFRTELRRLVDPVHELVRLAAVVDWDALDEAFGQYFCAGNGRPAIATRLMVSLHYLKYEHDLSDEEVVRMWRENPYWQYLSGMKWFEHDAPIDPTSMTRWRKRIGEAGAERMLGETLKAGLKVGAAKASQLARVNVDTTVQEKRVRYPTDARLYDRARERLVKEARKLGIKLRQSYARVGKKALLMQSRYAHTRKAKMARRETRKLRTWLGRVMRELERKHPEAGTKLGRLLGIAQRIHGQKRGDKGKVYSFHEPHVECLAKGKAHTKWEFGCKVGVVVSSRGGWFLGAKAYHGNPYDGHTLARALKQAEAIARMLPREAYADAGYRKHGYEGEVEVTVDKKRRGKTAKAKWKWMKRRAAVEPSIGHLKEHRRLDRNRLHGVEGDLVNIIFSAAGMNFAKILKHLRTLCALMLNWLRTLLLPSYSPCPSLLPA